MNRKDAKDAKAENRELLALSPETWPFSLALLPVPIYMVGGAVRDALLGRRREYLDLDFIVPSDAVQTARTIANYYKAGFVVLDAQRQIARVVFKDATADFAQQEGDRLETDLHRRDFTVNAIAFNPHTGELIDPLQGNADLQQGIIRMVSPANLEDDPLRLLRAYRQAAQLGFAIEDETRSTIRQLAPLLGQIAAERVRVELGYLLSSPQGTPWLTVAWSDGILRWILHDDVTATNLALVAEIDRRRAKLAEIWPQIGVELSSGVPGLAADAKRTWMAIAKLTCLLIPEISLSEIDELNVREQFNPRQEHPTPIPSPPRRGEQNSPLSDLGEGGRGVRFTPVVSLNYTRADIHVENSSVEDFLKEIKYSVPEIRAVNTILKFLPQLRKAPMSVREQYFMFREVGVVFPALVLVAVAVGIPVEEIATLCDRYLTPSDIVAHPTPLVTGNDLMQALNLKPSPKIGQLLTEIQIARIEDKISTPAEAINFASQLLDTEK
ncbi:CCA tRNA nucleotidyltransferase [Aerosakkonema sp. BLCC-F183]|uniref:CCA tRNA nucleotidyltransferase n=1 Tax=Aerosakkonema sp. BLCC-F183 TaxID=3342834 RepID=UPI0035BA3677